MSTLDKIGDDRETCPLPAGAPVHKEAVLWKVSLRLLPFLFLLYVLNILDRVNVGFARLQMLGDLGLDGETGERVYGLGAGIFFIGYFIFEVPSNLILRRMGARRWIARILMSWGLVSVSMMFVTAPWQFYMLRFLLGVAEAGFFPGIILYLSYWFPARQRAKAVARFMTGSAITSLIGSPLSGAILYYCHGSGGLAGWQWLFLLEGLPTVLLGFVTLYYLTDRPEQARWLAPPERAWLAERMRQEEAYRDRQHGITLGQTFANPRVWLLCALYFTVSMGANSYGLYLPKVLAIHFTAANAFEIGLLAALPALVTIVSMVAVAMHSDATGERRWHVPVPAFLAATGWTLAAFAPSPWLALASLALAYLGMMSMLAPFWSLPTSFLSGAAAAGGIAFINSVGNLGGFAGPYAISQVKAATDSFTGGFLILGAALAVGGCLAIAARHDAALEKPPEQTRPDNQEGK
jgi:MFS family permease